MTPEQAIVATAVDAWKINLVRADKLFSGLSEQQVARRGRTRKESADLSGGVT
jgi:hypothetical protein